MPAAPPAPPDAASRQRWTLIVAILGSTMAFLDGTVVNVALPALQRQMQASVVEAQWVVEAYALTLSALVLLGGALGDRYGRRRVFVAGVVGFTISSAACGFSPSIAVLVVARAVQGVAAAALVPGSLSLISAAYPEKTRGEAIGTWSAATTIAAAVGPVAGGWAVVHFSFRVVFFINVPLGAVVAYLATRRVAETRDPAGAKGSDALGAVLAVSSLGAVVWALLEAPAQGGLGSPRCLVPLMAGVALFVAFVLVERRSRSPMVPLVLFRSRPFSATNLLTLFLYAALGACFFFVPFDLIQVNHYSATAAGAALLPFVVLVTTMSPWAGKLATRHGPRRPLVAGPLITALGFSLLAVPSRGGSYVTTFFPGILALGAGMGLTIAPLTDTVMGSVDERHAGVASGINNAVSRAAGLLAIAALGVVLVSRFDDALDRTLQATSLPPEALSVLARERGKLAAAELPPSLPAELRHVMRAAIDDAFVAGFRALMFACAALSALSAGVAFALLRGSRTERYTSR